MPGGRGAGLSGLWGWGWGRVGGCQGRGHTPGRPMWRWTGPTHREPGHPATWAPPHPEGPRGEAGARGRDVPRGGARVLIAIAGQTDGAPPWVGPAVALVCSRPNRRPVGQGGHPPAPRDLPMPQHRHESSLPSRSQLTLAGARTALEAAMAGPMVIERWPSCGHRHRCGRRQGGRQAGNANVGQMCGHEAPPSRAACHQAAILPTTTRRPGDSGLPWPTDRPHKGPSEPKHWVGGDTSTYTLAQPPLSPGRQPPSTHLRPGDGCGVGGEDRHRRRGPGRCRGCATLRSRERPVAVESAGPRLLVAEKAPPGGQQASGDGWLRAVVVERRSVGVCQPWARRWIPRLWARAAPPVQSQWQGAHLDVCRPSSLRLILTLCALERGFPTSVLWT